MKESPNKGVITMTLPAWKLKEMEELCSDKTLPFPDNVIKELHRLNQIIDEAPDHTCGCVRSYDFLRANCPA